MRMIDRRFWGTQTHIFSLQTILSQKIKKIKSKKIETNVFVKNLTKFICKSKFYVHYAKSK